MFNFEAFEKEMLEKIDNGDNLTEKELSRLVCDFEIDREEGHNRRWTRSVKTIVRLGKRYFAIDWEEGLTECQENEFYHQPYEVWKNTYEKTITVTEWIKV